MGVQEEKAFFLEIAKRAAALFRSDECRAFVLNRVEEFCRQVAECEAQDKAARQECEQFVQKKGKSYWLQCFVDDKGGGWAVIPVRKVRRPRDAKNNHRQGGLRAEGQRQCHDLPGKYSERPVKVVRLPSGQDPRRLFPPSASWCGLLGGGRKPQSEEAALLRDCVLVAVIHDGVFRQNQPLCLSRKSTLPAWPGFTQWAEDLYGRLLKIDWVMEPSERSHVKAVISECLENVIQAAEDARTRQLKPLTKGARLIYEELLSLEPHQAMTTGEIQSWYENNTGKNLDEGTWKRYRQELKAYGIENRHNVGYYIRTK